MAHCRPKHTVKKDESVFHIPSWCFILGMASAEFYGSTLQSRLLCVSKFEAACANTKKEKSRTRRHSQRRRAGAAELKRSAKEIIPMNTPDDVLRLQTQLSECSGAKRMAEWLLVLALVLLVGSAMSAVIGKESLLRVIPTPLMMIALCLHMRAQAKGRASDLEKELS